MPLPAEVFLQSLKFLICRNSCFLSLMGWYFRKPHSSIAHFPSSPSYWTAGSSLDDMQCHILQTTLKPNRCFMRILGLENTSFSQSNSRWPQTSQPLSRVVIQAGISVEREGIAPPAHRDSLISCTHTPY